MSPWDTRADGELNDKRRIIATEDGVAFWENEGILHFVFPDGRSVEGGQLPVPGISLESLRYDIVSHRSFDGADASAVRRHMLVGPSACGFAAQPIACTASSDSVSCARGVDFSGDLEGGDARENPWTGPAERIALAKITDLTRGVEGQGYAVAWAARGASGGVEVHMGFLRDTGEMVTEPTLLWDAPGYRVVKGLEMAKLWSQRFGYQLAVGVIVEGQNNGDPDEFVLLGATLPVFGC